jgi:DNA-binding CsgD family transcriptional regulator
MEPLSFKDSQSLNQSVQKLYSLHSLDTFGVESLSIVNQLVPSDLPVFHSTHVRTRKISSTFLPGFPGFTPEMEKVVHRHSGEHPITKNMPKTLYGAYKVSDFVSPEELHRLKGIYQQFLRLLDTEDQMFFFLLDNNPVKWCKLLQADAHLVGFAIHRPERNFTERDRLVLNLLRPHIFQAYSNAQQYQQLQQNLSQLQQSLNHLGLVILDTDGQIQSITPQAILWLEKYFTKFTCSQKLPDLLWSWIKHQAESFTKCSDLPNACLPLRIQESNRELVIRLVIEKAENRYLLLLEEQTMPSLNSLALLGLSQREIEVLAKVMQGSDNKTIAIQLNINNTTVRKHLEHIYRKLDVNSRTAAISQVLEKLGFLNTTPSQ